MDQMGSWPEMDLPGFRFHPTEEELLDFYLKGAVHGRKLQPEIIRTINLYRYAPWELPGMARVGEREWYFFVPRDRRNNNGGRPNRTTDGGFWKATGSDRSIRSVSDPKRKIGLKKTLVFYEGRAPRGTRTDWVMNEYRLPEDDDRSSSSAAPKEDIVLCKIYRKATSMKELEQRAAIDKDARSAQYCGAATADNSSSSFSSSSSDHMETSLPKPPTVPLQVVVTDAGMKEMKVEVEIETVKEAEVTSVAVGPESPGRRRVRPELDVLQLPAGLGFDWAAHDPFLTPLRSPWLDLSPYYANVLNF